MIATLRIKNLALVADLTLELRPGCNVITGETGAGKSIIIGALNLLLGQRADRTLIRAGAESCTVEAVFDISALRPTLDSFLDENGLEPCDQYQLVLKRTFTVAGTNRQFINGSPATLQTLATLGDRLVDIHGPHDHQSLFNPALQLAILDAFGGLEKPRAAFASLFRQHDKLEKEKAALIVDERTYAQQLDLLRHQVQEIQAAQLNPAEEAEVLAAHSRTSNAARLLELSQSALSVLDGNEPSLLDQSGSLGRALQSLQLLDTTAAPLAIAQEQISAQIRELQQDLSRYADRVDIDPAQLVELDSRLNLIQSLKRKYGATLHDVITFGEEARAKLDALESRDAVLAQINAELDHLAKALQKSGSELSAQRAKLIPKLSKAVARQLSDLGFKQSQFDISISTALQPSATGVDRIEFQFAPNPGETARPLRAIASSGEMSRVMLALKTVLAAEDEIPVLVFDEVDANIGGETAHVVGDKMRQIASKRQVLCITHLAPVAAAADTHFVVDKCVSEGRTITDIQLLDAPARVKELTRMLGGKSDAARKHAEELLTGKRG